jgi:hypothetical protein
MDELKSILEKAISVPYEVVDPAADVARGHGGLRKRRMRRLGAGAAGLVVVAAVGGVLVTGGGGAGTTAPATALTPSAGPTTPGKPATTAPVDGSLKGIALVAYTGKQVPGYQVRFVPKGWEIQGGDSTVLVIALKGFKNQDIHQWVGKLAVMLQSKDVGTEAPQPITKDDLEAWGDDTGFETTVTKVTVNGQDGWIQRDQSTDKKAMVSVTFSDSEGHRIVVQGPESLNWNDTRWLKFAVGVKVLGKGGGGLG